MFIPSMDLKVADSRLMPFEDRFSLSRNETFESMSAYISTRRHELSEALGQDVVRITDCFSLYVFGGPYLVRSFEMDSTGAVAFALMFGNMNALDYDQYYIDISLQAAETGQKQTM